MISGLSRWNRHLADRETAKDAVIFDASTAVIVFGCHSDGRPGELPSMPYPQPRAIRGVRE